MSFKLWRPSFAGSWRDIGGVFSTREEANAYAESKPWAEHGMFTDWEITESTEEPTPRLTFIQPSPQDTMVSDRAVCYSTASMDTVRYMQRFLPPGCQINPQ